MSKEIINLIKKLENIQEDLNSTLEQVRLRIDCVQPDDRRITIFTQLFGILDRAKMGLEFCVCSLDLNEIKARMFSGLTHEEFLQRLNAFIHFIAMEMNQSYFSIIEAFLRQIHRELIKEPPLNFRDLTKSISINFDLPQWSEFLHFYSLVRNTQHNNGLFFPHKRKDELVLYKGIAFSFIYGKKIHFLNDKLRLLLIEDGNSFVYDLCISKKIIEHPHIQDPSHYHYTPIPSITH